MAYDFSTRHCLLCAGEAPATPAVSGCRPLRTKRVQAAPLASAAGRLAQLANSQDKHRPGRMRYAGSDFSPREMKWRLMEALQQIEGETVSENLVVVRRLRGRLNRQRYRSTLRARAINPFLPVQILRRCVRE